MGALGWSHTLFVCVAEQVMALFVAPFCSERKGEHSNERGGLWLAICPLGWGLPESSGLPGRKDGNKLLVLLVSCYVGDLPTEAYSIDMLTSCALGEILTLCRSYFELKFKPKRV